MVYYVLKDKEVEIVFEFNGLGDWVIYDTGDSGFFSEEAIGIAALYSYGTLLVIVTGWSLFIGVVVIIYSWKLNRIMLMRIVIRKERKYSLIRPFWFVTRLDAFI